MRPCKDCKKAHEMVLASMEYVKVLGFRIRKTEEISETWKKAAQTHAEECVKLREQLHHLRTAAESGMLPQIVKERDALRTECDDLRRVFSLVHASLGIQQGEHIGNAIEALKKERDELRAQLDTERERHKQKTVDVPRAHPVKVGEYVKNDNGDVCQVHEVYAEYLLNTGWTWAFENCAPCDPPEATHITPEGKAVAESAAEDIRVGDMVEVFQKTSGETLFDDVSIRGTVAEVFWAETGNKCVRLDSSTMNRRSLGGSYFAYCDVRKIAKETAQAAVTPQPGDVVRLVREPTHTDIPAMLPWSKAFGMPGDTATVVIMAIPDKLPNGTIPVRTSMGRAFFWPLSCVEVVKGGE